MNEKFKVGTKVKATTPDGMTFKGVVAKFQSAEEKLTETEILFFFEADRKSQWYPMLESASMDRIVIDKQNGTGYTLAACYLCEAL